tara:strand:+ start:330 stop:1454 length:1125 start_codon:yes stop_codon:yes gene_type:complete
MSEEIKKGLLGIVVDETTISHVVPELSTLTYRGYTVQELCDKCDFEEVAYLVLHGELPNKKQLKKFIKKERSERKLSKHIINDIKKMPKTAHPMDVIRTCVSLMALEDKDTKDNSPKANMRKAMRIFSKTPTAVAAYFRSRKGKKIIAPDKKLSFSENFFKMMFNKIPDKEIVRAFDISLILYAEHSFNVSTFTARTITSSLSDLHGAITGAIASLKGPLHGGANEAVMHMMKEIKKPENAKTWIENALEKKKVVMGFGHRVYRTGDSRVPTMKHYMFKVAKLLKKEKYTQIYEILEKVMLEKKNIYPNVDFPCGPTYYMMGIDIDFYTPIFVMSRITGWSAHIMEQHTSNKLIRPLSKYKGQEVREVMLLNQR